MRSRPPNGWIFSTGIVEVKGVLEFVLSQKLAVFFIDPTNALPDGVFAPNVSDIYFQTDALVAHELKRTP